MKQVSKLHFAMAIVLPMLFAAGIAWFQTYNLINELVVMSEKAAFARSEKLIRSGLKAYRGQLERVLLDNADWDDAAAHVYGTPDIDWIVSTWSTTAKDPNAIYDTMMIVDGATSNVLVAHGGGHRLNIRVSDIFGDSWPKILASLSKQASNVRATSVFVKTPEGVSAAAIAPVSKGQDTSETASTSPRYLVFVRKFDKPLLAQLAEQYAVRDLSLHEKDVVGRGSVTVSDELGSFSPAFSWQTNLHSFTSKSELWARAVKTLVATLLVLIGMAAACWRLLQKVQKSERMALHAANHDNLTGLGNRAAFNQKLEQACAVEHWQCSVAFADLDGFKAVNDTLGHKAGDVLLTNVANIIAKTVGDPEAVFRLGGDEFVALFMGENHAKRATDYAASIIEALRQPMDLQGQSATVGVSIGIARSASDCADGQELVRRADEAMYQAKQAGRNRYVVFGETHQNSDASIQQLRQLFADVQAAQQNAEDSTAPISRRSVRG